MPTGVLHLKEVDTDKITLDGKLSVSGEARLKGPTVIVDNALSVGTTTTLAADTTATNVNLTGTLSVSGQTTIGGHIIPDTNDAYDIGSPEFKIRDMYVSDNSLWIGDTTKISNVNGSLKFRKRKTNVVPKAIVQAGANAGHANEAATTAAALAHAGVSSVEKMKMQHWHKFMRTLNAAAKITDIFRENDDDYEETSASDAWKEISDTKIYTNTNVGIGTSDPDTALHVKGSFKLESEDDGFQLIRSTVGAPDPQLIIDTKNFGVDDSIEDKTGQNCTKFTKLYRVHGTNSEGYGRDWYWGLANDEYTNISLAVGGESGGNDPDLAFTFTTTSELYCNKVYAALGGNADTATRLATPRKINGVDFDGTQDITIAAGVDGIETAGGEYGTVTTQGGLRSWGGYAIQNQWVLMAHTNGNHCGIYNDQDNEWGMYCDRNSHTRLHWNGSEKARTESWGFRVKGRLHQDGFGWVDDKINAAQSAANAAQSAADSKQPKGSYAHVNGRTNTSFNCSHIVCHSSYNQWMWGRYYNKHGKSGSWEGWRALSVYAAQHIRCNEIHATSDRRIKKDIEHIDDDSALQMLRKIQPRTYAYIDECEHGPGRVFGFIAQEVKDIMPHAVAVQEGDLPNIQRFATVDYAKNVITLEDFDTENLNNTENIIFMDQDEQQQTLKIKSVLNSTQLEIEDDLREALKSMETSRLKDYSYTGKIFVWGQKVNDFHHIQKSAIFTVATAALQEVDRQLQAEKVRNDALEARNDALEARNDALEAKFSELNDTLVKKIGEMESVIQELKQR